MKCDKTSVRTRACVADGKKVIFYKRNVKGGICIKFGFSFIQTIKEIFSCSSRGFAVSHMETSMENHETD